MAVAQWQSVAIENRKYDAFDSIRPLKCIFRNQMKVIVKKQIHGCFASASTKDVILEREFNLPFTPFPQMNIIDGDWQETISEVVYDVQHECFICHTEPDQELYLAQLHNRKPTMTLDEIVADYIDEGWEKK